MTKNNREQSGICGICSAGCGIIATYDENDKILSVRPDITSPIGHICRIGEHSPEIIYSKNRLKYPLKRVGPKGTYDFKRISWDEAYDILVNRLTLIKEKYGPEFEKKSDYTRLVWDTIAAAVVIDPAIITEEETRWIDVNADYTLDYGRSLSYKMQGPVGTQKARILFSIDEERFWDLMVDLMTQ